MDALLSADSTINLMDHHEVAAVSLTGISQFWPWILDIPVQ